MKKILFFVTVSVLALSAQNKFRVDFDYSRFNYSDSSGYLEIYYSFFQPNLTAILNSSSENTVKGILGIKIQDEASDSILVHKNYQFSNILQPADSAAGKSLTGNIGFVIPVGKYRVFLEGMDGNDTSRTDTVSFYLTINEPPEDRYWISDIQLAGSIKESDNTNSLFYKNTFEVIPNPSSIYGEPLPVLYFYSEIYNINKNISSPVLKIDQILLDSQNQPFIRKSKQIPRQNQSVVEVGALNVSRASSGAYLLVLAVTDTMQGQTFYSSKRIFVYNPSIVDTSINVMLDQDVMSSEFSAMSEEELDEVFAFSKYVATSQEIDRWDKLNELEAKRSFVFNFWKARDIDLNTPVNEAKRDYFARVERANIQYATMQKKGWKTDRGRVYIIYGEPSEIERYPNQVDTKPYEIWQYEHLEGGVIFVFADLTGFGDYQLIHSTHRNELRDDDWTRKIGTY